MLQEKEERIDMMRVRQWMELVNELVESLVISVERGSKYLPSDTQYKLRTVKKITESIRTPPTSIKVPFLHTCNSCQKGFDKPSEKLEDYHRNTYTYHCPHCSSQDIKQN